MAVVGRAVGVFGTKARDAAPTIEQIREAIRPIEDPELGVGIVDLGLIYDISCVEGKIAVSMTLTTPFCPLGPMLKSQIQDAVGALRGVKSVDVEFVWSPPWDPHKMASEEAKDMLGIW